jgi:Zn-dependent peptidase ImmA (M78 family)/transcriptional regulator with XRE-family HTH domain
MTYHPFNPEMLTLARMSRGLTQTELATTIETTQGRVSKIEHGFFVPGDDLVDRFARALSYPREFFFQPGYINTLPSWFHRRRKQLAQTTVDRIHAEIAIRIRNIVKLLMSADVKAVHPVPQFEVEAFDGSVEHVARAVRHQWALPRGPIDNLIEVLERAGVLVVPCDFGATEIDAVGMRLQGMPPIVFINDAAPVDRVRFTVAHELGHLVMHASGSEGDVEKEADRFAAEFLMPEYDIKPQLTNITLAILSVLKRVWRVSMASLLVRAKTLRTITEKRATTLWKQMAALGFKKREPAELDLSPEKPRLLREMIEFHSRQLNMTAEQLLAMFTLLQPDFDRFYAPERRGGSLRLVVA